MRERKRDAEGGSPIKEAATARDSSSVFVGTEVDVTGVIQPSLAAGETDLRYSRSRENDSER